MARRRTLRAGEKRYRSTVNIGVVHVTMATFVPDSLKDTAVSLHVDGSARKRTHARSLPSGRKRDKLAEGRDRDQ